MEKLNDRVPTCLYSQPASFEVEVSKNKGYMIWKVKREIKPSGFIDVNEI